MTAFTLALGGVAKATTGALELVHPPHVIVPYPRALQFEGRYYLTSVGRGANIRAGGMKIEFSPGSAPKYLIGAAQFYEYNDSGQIETALFTLFPFRETPTGVTATILKKGVGGPDRTPPLGALTLERPTADGRMEGEIELRGGPYPVVFTRLGDDEKGFSHSPTAKQTREAAPDLKSGWSADPATVQGEYELVEPAADGSAGAGSLGAVVSLTQHLTRAGAEPTGGDLAVLRGEPPIGEVNLELGSIERTFYLTDLSRRGDFRVATVRGGSPTGPKAGRFTGTQSTEVLKGTLTADGSRYLVAFKKEDG